MNNVDVSKAIDTLVHLVVSGLSEKKVVSMNVVDVRSALGMNSPIVTNVRVDVKRSRLSVPTFTFSIIIRTLSSKRRKSSQRLDDNRVATSLLFRDFTGHFVDPFLTIIGNDLRLVSLVLSLV